MYTWDWKFYLRTKPFEIYSKLLKMWGAMYTLEIKMYIKPKKLQIFFDIPKI